MSLAEVLDILQYSHSRYYIRTGQKQEPEVASLFRAAYAAGVDGIYVFQSSGEKDPTFSVKPAVYVAEAQTSEEARKMHQKLWNSGKAPFLIVVLPNEVRVYTGFDYAHNDDGIGVVEPPVALDQGKILDRLGDFCAEAINDGHIWSRRSQYLKPERRIDRRLLGNLNALGLFLRERMGLLSHVAHTLIGKYVYIRYLRDRNILSDQWFEKHGIDIETVLGRKATVNGLRRLCMILDTRFNGSIFPLDFSKDAPGDEHVRQVAAIFKGDEPLPGGGRQLSLPDFQVYDFAYIPIELLSSIYEQFLHVEGKGQRVGAYYTPEYLADYLIAEISSVKPLREGMKILDPSCGSGVFLVLAYARLIEQRLAQAGSSGTLPLSELLRLLTYIYGIEREVDACYVTEFSLILMLLHYADVSEFLRAEHLKLPSLHNEYIFHSDFFDDSSRFWMQNMQFDWVIGNPPWISADAMDEPLASTWIEAQSKEYPVDNKSVAEAFSWRILHLLSPDGYAALLLPVSLLYNIDAWRYRQSFFEQCEVKRMTNFSNLRKALFEGKAVQPAVTMIYHRAPVASDKSYIEHYGPFAINQITESYGKLWTLTINEHEYQSVSPYEAARGDIMTWKFALWGSHRDKRAIARLRKLFPQTLGQYAQQHAWYLSQGPDLRNSGGETHEELRPVLELSGKKRVDTHALNMSRYIFSIPDKALKDISPEECYIRVRGGEKGLYVSYPPHIVMNAGWKYSIFSDQYFVIRPRQIGLSAPWVDADLLRALSVFLSSDLVRYYMFFQASQWGIERDVVTLESVKSIPIPTLTVEHIRQLATLQQELAALEVERSTEYARSHQNMRLAHILQLPESMTTLVNEFLQLRVGLVGGGTKEAVRKVRQRPDQHALAAYARQLATSLDGFLDSGSIRHRVTIEQSPTLICCTVDFVRSERAFEPFIDDVSSRNKRAFHQLQQNVKQEFSQWVYVQRGLKIFGPSSVSLYKMPHLINWTRTQAMNDADDIIAETLSMKRSHNVRHGRSILGR